MCELMRCQYEDDDDVQCEWCPYNEEWDYSDFDNFDYFEDFNKL